MREHLLGYLLGALDPEESRRVEEGLQNDENLRREVHALRQCLAPLAADRGPLQAPFELAVRTCRYVALQSEVVTPALAAAGSSRWRFQDMVVAASVFLAASMLFFPAASHSRYNAQLASCQNNLRQLGISLVSYSQWHDGFFPRIPLQGNDGVGGVVAPILLGEQYLDQPTWFICPARASSYTEEFRVPSREELQRADAKVLRYLQRRLSGDYGYNLGVMVDGRYDGLRNRGRSTFALMADAPCWKLGAKKSANHGGRGQNVLFEDGHVEFQPLSRHITLSDDFYRNDDGFVAAGTHRDDAVIGHSTSVPVIFTSSN